MIRRGLTLALGAALVFTLAVPVPAQQFGGSVVLSGDRILVGESQNQTLPGIVYVYARDGTIWRESGRMTIDGEVGPPDGFGRAMTGDGEVLLVGAPMRHAGMGAVHVYRPGGPTGWTAADELTPGGAADSAGFGAALAMAGSVAVVGAPGDAMGAGRLYLFRRTANGGWVQTDRIAAPSGRGLGAAVAIDGGTLVAATAARRNTPAEVFAYRIDAAGRASAPVALEVEGLEARSGFGTGLGARDGRVYVGAPNVAQRSGAVFAFEYDAGAWATAERLVPFDATTNTQFGTTIQFAANAMWVGAPGAVGGTGALYEFARDDNGWASARIHTSRTLEGRAAFGSRVAVGSDLAVVGATGVDSRAGAAVVLERSAAGEWVERNTLINDMRGLPAITGDEVSCESNRAAGFECDAVNVISFLPIKDIGGVRGTRVNDVWGWTDPETRREYAIVGRTDGTSFVDITDPYRPVYVGDLPKTPGSRSSIWRDMKVYRDHVYVVADAANEHGVQVFDLRQLRDVRGAPVTFEPTATYDGIHSAHNIVINEETGFAYAVGNSSGGETCGGGLHMISLENPSQPVFAGCFADASTGRRKTGYSHDAQCVLYRGPDASYRGREICVGSNETALSIADVTDKANPIAVSSVSYPNVAYTHQGWLTEDHRYFYLNDEGDEPQGLVPGTRTLVWDVSDLDDPVLIKEHFATTTTTDHNLYVRGNLMYQSNYGSGLRVLDISNPEDPVEIGFFDTTPYGGSGSWSNYPFFESGVIVATSTGDGVFVLKSTSRPRLIP